MSKVTKRTVSVSTVSTAVALGLAAVVVGRRAKVEKPPIADQQLAHQEMKKVDRARLSADLYTHDDDLGYC
ncbi:MAG: hypothetical protein AAGI23_02875 [Bacteroidota bacterium]